MSMFIWKKKTFHFYYLMILFHNERTHDNVSVSNSIKEERRMAESKRSLSLIYPSGRQKRTNSTIMKLLSNVESLSALFQKNSNQEAANQLIQKYGKNKTLVTKAEAISSFSDHQLSSVL